MLYEEAHVPGAIGLDWRTDLQDQVRRDFLGPDAFAALFGSHGVSSDHTIVLYGDRNNWFAAYTYWYLNSYGHRNVKLMNGPRETWIAEGRPTSGERRQYLPAAFRALRGDDTIRATRWSTSARRRSSPASCTRAADVKNYDGSWTEWGNLVNVPIERG